MNAVTRPDGFREYTDPLDPALVYRSVTTIIGSAQSQPWLKDWASRVAAEFAVTEHKMIGWIIDNVGADAARQVIADASERIRDLKAEAGRYQHDVLEALLLDAPIPPVPHCLLARGRDGFIPHPETGKPLGVMIDGAPYDYDAVSMGLVNFLSDLRYLPEMSEATVCNPLDGYAGTLDTIGVFPGMRLDMAPGAGPDGVRVLLDAKHTGVVPDTVAAQLAAYRRCTEVWVDRLGNRAAMPAVDVTGVLHLNRRHRGGYLVQAITPADDAAGWMWFRSCLRQLADAARVKRPRGNPVYAPLPDGSQPLPYVEHVPELGRAHTALREWGVERVGDLAAFTAAEVRQWPGVGPAAMTTVRSVLAGHGLGFAAATPPPLTDLAGHLGVRTVSALNNHGITDLADVPRYRRELVASWLTGPAMTRLEQSLTDYDLTLTDTAMEVA